MSVEDAIMVAAVAENYDGDVFYELVVIVIVFPWAINCHNDDDDEQHILDFVISLSNGCFRSSSKNIVQKSHQKQNNKSRIHTLLSDGGNAQQNGLTIHLLLRYNRL